MKPIIAIQGASTGLVQRLMAEFVQRWPLFNAEWNDFAGPLAEFVSPDFHALDRWWRRLASKPLAA